MVIDELRDLVSQVEDQRSILDATIAQRNEAILELKEAGIAEQRIANMTGLARNTITRIVTGARSARAQELDALASSRIPMGMPPRSGVQTP